MREVLLRAYDARAATRLRASSDALCAGIGT
jgi:hypothetical protein